MGRPRKKMTISLNASREKGDLASFPRLNSAVTRLGNWSELLAVIALAVWIPLLPTGLWAQQSREEVRRLLAEGDPTAQPPRQTFVFAGQEREYFVQLPKDFRSDRTYWLLVAAHGGGGNGADPRVGRYGVWADRLGLDAIVVTPSFHQTDAAAVRFPSLGEDAFLRRVIARLRSQYQLREKILLSGYSRGAQFSHRFALGNPDLVHACAPLAAGTWTTPDGRFLMDGIGEVNDPKKYLSSMAGSELRENLRTNFDPRVAEAAGLRAKGGAERIPFLVMCGTLDSRLEIARAFAASLEAQGYEVETGWPRSPHGPTEVAHVAEWEGFRRRAIEFFLKVTRLE